MNAKPEHEESLWWLAASPVVWAVHFLTSYITAAIWCAKAVPYGGTLATARLLIGIYTTVALLLIVAVGFRGFRRHRFGSASVPHDFDTPEDRHRFLGFAVLLLSSLSAIAVVYDVFPILYFEACR